MGFFLLPIFKMGRAKTVLQSEHPYNISGRCINRDWFNLPMVDVWKIFCEELTRVVELQELQIHSFVLMSNHFHLIATTPKANISECMHQLMGRTSRQLTRAGNRINQTYSGRHFKCVLQHPNYYLNAYKYNYRNPVEAGIVERAEDYPFSTIQGLLGKINSKIPMIEDTTYLSDPLGTLAWINHAPNRERLEGVRYGLKHQYFRSKKCKITNRPIISEADLL